MADLDNSRIEDQSEDSSSSSSDYEVTTTPKEKKKRRQWKQPVLHITILKYLLTSQNVPTCIHGTSIPSTTFKEKAAEYMKIVDKYKGQQRSDDSQTSEIIITNTEEDNEESEAENTKSVSHLAKIRSQICVSHSLKFPKVDFPDVKDITDAKVEEILERCDLPPFPSKKKMGHSTVFKHDEEQQMVVYLKEMSDMGFPRTRHEFQIDVRLYYLCKTDQDEEAKDYVFSKSWCKRFRKDNCPSFKFTRQTQAEKIKNKMVDSTSWQEEVKRKVMQWNENELIASSDSIFFIECLSLLLDRQFTEDEPHRYLTLMICYNASGNMLKPLIVRNGKVSQETKRKYQDYFIFHTVDPPQINQACLLLLNEEIEKYQIDNNLDSPTLLYLSPQSATAFGYIMWQYSKDNFLIPVFMPPSVYKILEESEHGICQKIKDEWKVQKTLKEIRQEEEIAWVDSYVMLKAIWNQLRIKTKMIQTFRDLKLRLVQPKSRKRKLDEENSDKTQQISTHTQEVISPEGQGVDNTTWEPEENVNTQLQDTVYDMGSTVMKEQAVDFNMNTNHNEQVTSITCSNCKIMLELNEDILHEIIVSQSGRFDQLMLQKVKENLDRLEREKKSTATQCELIGSTSDWRSSWPVKIEK